MDTTIKETTPAEGTCLTPAPSKVWPTLMLFSRVLLFALFGLAFVLILYLSGSPAPFQAVVKWWLFQVVLANLVCFLLLRRLARREGGTFLGLIRFDRKLLSKDIKIFLILLVISGAVGYFGVYGATLLVYGGAPPVNVS
jgi:hypothetical protein